MSEALVSFLVEQLGSIFLQQVEQNVRLVVNVKKEVLNITHNLQTIQAVLADAEMRQVKEANVRLWLNNLKEVSFEIDDVVDEWSTEILKQQIEKQSEHAIVPKKKKLLVASISCYLPSPYIGTSSLKPGTSRTRQHVERLGLAQLIVKSSEYVARISLHWLLNSEPMDYECNGIHKHFTSCSFFWFTLLSMLDLLSPEVHLVMGEGAASTPVWLYMSVAADEISGGRLNRKAKLVTSSCSFGKIFVICVGNASETGEPSVSFSVLLTLETPV